MTNFYRRIPRVVRALQFILTDTFEAELREFTGGKVEITRLEPPQLAVKTNGHVYTACPGDWILEWDPGKFVIFMDEILQADFEPFPAPPAPASGTLEIGTTGRGEVVINHPDLKPDAQGCGHIVFSPQQAEALADLLIVKSKVARTEVSGRA